jgi:glutamate-ammonia-ligase adenylyltransferase
VDLYGINALEHINIMLNFIFTSEQADFPAPADPKRARISLQRWLSAAENTADGRLGEVSRAAFDNPSVNRFLSGVFGNSPYLARLAARHPQSLAETLEKGPDAAFEATIADIGQIRRDGAGSSDLGRFLRTAKDRVALTTALADIAGAWNLEGVTGALSRFAEAALSLAAAHLLRQAAADGAIELAHEDDPERDSGLIVLGLGKLGGRELNYSSDVDLMVFFDAGRIRTKDSDALQSRMARLARNLARLMEERTGDGYVFRMDLRLRPDPSAMPLAISVRAAETYYESLGQNWERAAMIKARPVAGDKEAGGEFLDRLKPFIWRKNLDFAAIRDIHSIKRQINAHRGGGKIALNGHNIKLGRGGIREIEFFAQTQQLIWGGREPSLRASGTVQTLRALAERGLIKPETAGDLTAAYEYLRRVEHRLQMVNDEQTHSLPGDDAALGAFALFMGYGGSAAFADDILGHLRAVERHYAQLFEKSPDLGLPETAAGNGNLVFTGGEPDPETLSTLKDLGFTNAATVDGAIRGWHRGRYRAMRSTRARELLTELTPTILKTLSAAPDPDAAFIKFDEFLSRLPSGVQLFSMFHAKPQLLLLVVEILGLAPRLGEHLSRRPQVLESVLEPGFFDPLAATKTLAFELTEDLNRALGQASNPEDVLDAARRWTADRQFQSGVQILLGTITPARASWQLSAIAEAAISGLLPRVTAEFEAKHGRIPGSGMAVLAMGKLGGREMTPRSDLDLIFVYAGRSGDSRSDGPRSLAVGAYFARLSQRLINALGAQTTEGSLYEVDMRLRPSGKAGPIASSLEAFIRYHEQSAWTWEHMALTRARLIAVGKEDGELKGKIAAVINKTLTRARDAERLLADVAHMRGRMAAEHPAGSVWEVKHLRGGLVDVEFIAQYLQLRHAAKHPGILSQNTWMALRRLGATGILEKEEAAVLIDALTLWQGLQMILRLTIEGAIGGDEDLEAPALRQILAKVAGTGDQAPVDFAALKAKIKTTAEAVKEIYRRRIKAL